MTAPATTLEREGREQLLASRRRRLRSGARPLFAAPPRDPAERPPPVDDTSTAARADVVNGAQRRRSREPLTTTSTLPRWLSPTKAKRCSPWAPRRRATGGADRIQGGAQAR
jgi:hypothetical protein